MKMIQNGYLTRYLEENIQLAKTIIVKLTEAALLINEGLVAKYGKEVVNTSSPKTWKYYLNLAGQYHPTDTVMTVVSIDTLEIIEFTVENLRIHTATRKAHSYGTRYYHNLVYRYPKQEGLINSILNPVDIDKAIEAENGTILGYPEDLVESNETTLMMELEKYLKRSIYRWFNAQFIMSDNLFCTVFFTTLHMLVLPELLNLRLKRCKTPEVHSFHVRMYLASHQGLDRYLPYLTLKQSLWLYRNILYIERNAGKVRQFGTLVQKLLTERGIPIGEYSVRQLDQFQDNFRPKAAARRKMINSPQNVLSYSLYDLDYLFNKEIPIEVGNAEYFDANRDSDTFRVETTNSSVTQTKVLESSMVDYTDAVSETFEEIALRQWCYLSTHNLYNVAINFKDPKTGEFRVLSSQDAFIYMYYVQCRADGLIFDEIPEFLNMQQRIHPKPTVQDLLDLVPSKEVDLTLIAETILLRQPIIQPCFSVTAFYNQSLKIYEEAYWHMFLISSMQDLYERGLVENMVKRLYEDVRVKFDVPDRRVGSWLVSKNLPTYDFDREEALLLVKAIFSAATGMTVNDARLLKNIQKAMINLMTELSSYSIQFTREINSEDIVIINPPSIRFGQQRLGQDERRNTDVGVLVLDGRSHEEGYANVGTDVETRPIPKQCVSDLPRAILIDPNLMTVSLEKLETSCEVPSSPCYVSMTYPGQNEALEASLLLPGYTSFESLPESARQKLKSHYQ